MCFVHLLTNIFELDLKQQSFNPKIDAYIMGVDARPAGVKEASNILQGGGHSLPQPLMKINQGHPMNNF
jgi:hypothetical protein